MFDIIIKPSTVHVDCFTSLHVAYNYAKIDYATNFYPEWWKKLPKESYGHAPKPWIPFPTMKTCQGFISLYQNALIIPMWTETIIQTTENNIDVSFAENWFSQPHAYFQREGFLKNYHHTKILSPWLFKCKKDIGWSFQKPMYNFENPLDFILFDGVVDFKYQNTTNINLGIRKTNKTTIIGFRQPLVLLTPHTEKRLVIKNHFVSKEEYEEMSSFSGGTSTFINKYLSNKKIIKEKESKCPFGF
jgi:hypothetical protein